MQTEKPFGKAESNHCCSISKTDANALGKGRRYVRRLVHLFHSVTSLPLCAAHQHLLSSSTTAAVTAAAAVANVIASVSAAIWSSA